MPNATPQDALVILQLYDLRREAEMRKARNYLLREFWPATFEDAQKVANSGGDENRYFRQVYSYWNMAAALANHGAVQPELLIDTENELFIHYAKIKPFLAEMRKTNPTFLKNIEQLIEAHPAAQQKLAGAEKRVAMMRERFAKA